MLKKNTIITIGGAVRDITLFTNQGVTIPTPDNLTAQKLLAFEYGAKVPVHRIEQCLGGGAANVACGLASLGVRTGIVCRVGNDQNGQAVLAQFKRFGIATKHVQIDQRQQTGFSVILIHDKRERERLAFSYRGANDGLLLTTQSLKGAAVVYLSSLSGDWLPVAKHVFAVTVPIAWNPGAEQIKAGYATIAPFLKKTALFIVNKDEAIELVLTGMKVGRKNHSYLNKPAYLLNVLKEWCPGIVMVTDGHRGAYAHDGTKLYFEKAKKVTVHDTTGVGDAFAAGVVAGLYDLRLSVQQALLCGILNSASVATKVGAQEGLLNRSSLQSKLS